MHSKANKTNMNIKTRIRLTVILECLVFGFPTPHQNFPHQYQGFLRAPVIVLRKMEHVHVVCTSCTSSNRLLFSFWVEPRCLRGNLQLLVIVDFISEAVEAGHRFRGSWFESLPSFQTLSSLNSGTLFYSE